MNIRTIVTVATIAVGTLLLAPAVAHAQEAPAYVRVAHFSPDTPGVDVYVDGALVVGNMGFEVVSDYLPVPPGERLFELRPSGAAPTTPAVVSTRQRLDSGVSYTAAGLGPRAELEAGVFVDDVAMAPAGMANVRFVHAAVDAPDVDVRFGTGGLEFADAAFATVTPYRSVAPGTYDISLTDDSGIDLVGSNAVAVTAGVNYTVVAIGGGDVPVRIVPVVDARAAAVAPAGGVATGAGGTADARAASMPAAVPVALVVAIAGVLGLATSVLIGRRLRSA